MRYFSVALYYVAHKTGSELWWTASVRGTYPVILNVEIYCMLPSITKANNEYPFRID